MKTDETVRRHARVEVADVLRGFAVMAIILLLFTTTGGYTFRWA